MAGSRQHADGFTLVEVLVAMAITALVAIIAYTALSAALASAERKSSAASAARASGSVAYKARAYRVASFLSLMDSS